MREQELTTTSAPQLDTPRPDDDDNDDESDGGGGVEDMTSAAPSTAQVLNVNVPNMPVDEVSGWRYTVTGSAPPRSLTTAELVPKEGHAGSYRVDMHWGEAGDLPEDTDGGAVMAGMDSLTYLNRLHDETPPTDRPAARGLDDLLGI